MKLLMFLIMFLLLGGFFIISEKEIRMNSIEGMNKFLDLYGVWIDGLVVNSLSVGSYVIKMEWLPK